MNASPESRVITNAASTGIRIDRATLKSLARRSDRPGLVYLALWALALSGAPLWFALGTPYVWAAVFVFGVVMSVPSYALSHETAHGTAFRTRWLNEAVFWFTSLFCGEEPLHRRYTHTNHHTHTWYVGLDSQMPFDTPLMREVSPEAELPKMTRNARPFGLIYLGAIALIASGHGWPLLWFYVLPRLIGGPVMLMFNIIQHAEMQENSPSIVDSTRTFRTNWVGRFLYLNMNNHVEHHLYPQVPFYSLPRLHEAVAEQTPEPDPGFQPTNLDLLWVVIRCSLGRGTRAAWIRQAPHMVRAGGAHTKISKATMQ